jgi:SpoVK/Ycf46/Vps4 family AAA+-type ATPase
VRALFHGPPGTGKTLAAAWLARQLGLPLFRVDLAGVLSKYIGETEKNLAAMLSAAEAAEVVLLFDEADALFGKRTEIRSANDRFANTQTDYLLQRLEAWSGIAVLTTNHRAGLDEAFTRRLDAVIELPLPAPAERRALWDVHLGTQHALTASDINRLAATLPVAGGHIRNAVLAAAVTAREQQRPLRLDDVIGGMESELRKLGRQLPPGVRDR